MVEWGRQDAVEKPVEWGKEDALPVQNTALLDIPDTIIPEEHRIHADRMRNAANYSQMFSQPTDTTFDMEPAINDAIYGRGTSSESAWSQTKENVEKATLWASRVKSWSEPLLPREGPDRPDPKLTARLHSISHFFGGEHGMLIPPAIIPKSPVTEQVPLRQKTTKTWQRGAESLSIDFVWRAAGMGQITDAEAQKITAEFKRRVKADPIEARNWLENIYLKTVGMAPGMFGGILEGAKYGTVGAGIGAGFAAVAGQVPPLTILPEEAATIPAGVVTGLGIGNAVGQMKFWGEQGYGAIYRQGREEGLSKKTAHIAASIGGPLYGAIEHSQVDKIIPGLARLKGGLLKLGLRLVRNVLQEVGEEGAQRIVQDGAVLLGQIAEEEVKLADVPDKVRVMGQNAIDEMWEALGPMILLQGPGGAAATLNIIMDSSKKQDIEVLDAVTQQEVIQEFGPTEPPIEAAEKPAHIAEKAPERPVAAREPTEAVITPEKPVEAAVEPEVIPTVPEAKPVKEIETPEERKIAEAQLEIEAAEEVEPNLYIGSVTEGMKKRIEAGTGLSAKDMQGFKEKGWPTIRTKIKMARGEAEQYLEFLEKHLVGKLEKNQIRTENDLAKANAEWGDIKTLREVLGLKAVKRPFSVSRAEKHKVKVIKNVKSTIFEAIRPTEESKMTVGEVLTTVMKRSARAARIASAAGRRELRAEIRTKRRAKARITKALKILKQKISSRVDFFYREAIQTLTSGIDLAFRAEKTIGQRKATADFIERVPKKATDIPVKLMRKLSQKPLNEFTIEELEQLAAEVERLIEQGKVKRRLKLKPELQKRKATVKQLNANTEKVTPSRVKAGPKVLSTTKQGIIKTSFDKLKAWTWTPQRLFDMLDGGKNFRGLWHDTLYNQTKNVESTFFARKQSRRGAFSKKTKQLKLSTWQLSGMRNVSGVRYQAQELIGIYMASKNRLSKLVLRYGHNLSDSQIQGVINALTEKERALADFMLADYEKNHPRLRRAVIEQENRDMGIEENYSPIRRTGDFARTLESEIIDSMLRREQIRRHNVEHGFTLPRKEVPKEMQTPMRLDAVNVYLSQIEKQERYIAIGPHVRTMNKILANKALRKTVVEHFGSDINKTLDGYVASVANPYIYKQFSDIDRASSYLRRNTALAYLGYNFVTMGKQLPSILLYLPDAGPSHLLASAVEFATNPRKTIEKVRKLDPETAERTLEREFEEFRRAAVSKRFPNASLVKQKIGQYGLEGIYLFDKVARTIGWNAVYEQALSSDKSQAEAIQLARNATLRTQPAAAAEDIPALYRTNEILNWFTMFTNQLNKLFNIATYDVPSYIQNEEYSKAALQSLAMGIVALTIWIVTKRKFPEEPEDFAEAIGEQAINMVPLIGKPIIAARRGWDSDIPVFEGVKGLAVATTDLELTRRDVEAMAEGIAVTTGLPYTAVRRGVQAVEEEQPTALLGARRPESEGF